MGRGTAGGPGLSVSSAFWRDALLAEGAVRLVWERAAPLLGDACKVQNGATSTAPKNQQAGLANKNSTARMEFKARRPVVAPLTVAATRPGRQATGTLT